MKPRREKNAIWTVMLMSSLTLGQSGQFASLLAVGS